MIDDEGNLYFSIMQLLSPALNSSNEQQYSLQQLPKSRQLGSAKDQGFKHEMRFK